MLSPCPCDVGTARVSARPWPFGEALSPSPADHARSVLLDEPGLSNAEVALRARCKPVTARAARQELAKLGLLPPSPYPQRRFPRFKDMPKQPWLAEGLCVGHPQPFLWTEPPDQAAREFARHICRLCPVIRACQDWSVETVPDKDAAMYGGWSQVDRRHAPPALSLGRVNHRQLQRALAHHHDPSLPTEFD